MTSTKLTRLLEKFENDSMKYVVFQSDVDEESKDETPEMHSAKV